MLFFCQKNLQFFKLDVHLLLHLFRFFVWFLKLDVYLFLDLSHRLIIWFLHLYNHLVIWFFDLFDSFKDLFLHLIALLICLLCLCWKHFDFTFNSRDIFFLLLTCRFELSFESFLNFFEKAVPLIFNFLTFLIPAFRNRLA